MHVFVVWNDTRGSVVVLDRKTSPLNRRATQRRMRMQEWLDATRANDFNSGDNGPIRWCPRWRHVDLSNPRNGTRAGMTLLAEGSTSTEFSEDLHILSVL